MYISLGSTPIIFPKVCFLVFLIYDNLLNCLFPAKRSTEVSKEDDEEDADSQLEPSASG